MEAKIAWFIFFLIGFGMGYFVGWIANWNDAKRTCKHRKMEE